MELGEATVLAVLVPVGSPKCGDDRLERTLRLCTYPRGDEILSIPGVLDIEDGFVHHGVANLLLRLPGHVQLLRLSEAGGVVGNTRVELGLGSVACAAFIRGEVGETLRAWAVGWKGKELVATPFAESGADAEHAFRLSFDGGSSQDVVDVGESLRATARVQESNSYLAVSWPGYHSLVGTVQVIDVTGEPKVLWEGRPFAEVHGDSLVQYEYGHAIAFVPDTNRDGVPEILVTGPWECVDPRVDLLSGRTGTVVRSWTPGLFHCTGHSLSLSVDSRWALVGGADQQCEPENLAEEGQAHLLDVVRMKALQTWRFRPRER
jgi:hypothetical protein